MFVCSSDFELESSGPIQPVPLNLEQESQEEEPPLQLTNYQTQAFALGVHFGVALQFTNEIQIEALITDRVTAEQALLFQNAWQVEALRLGATVLEALRFNEEEVQRLIFANQVDAQPCPDESFEEGSINEARLAGDAQDDRVDN